MALSLVLILALAACGGTNAPAQNNTAMNENSSDNTPTDNTSASNNTANTPAEDTATENPPPANSADNSADHSGSGDTETTATVSFSADVLPIINSRCENCHGGDKIEKDLNLLSYNGIMAGSEDGAVVAPGDVAGSLLYDLISSGKMPKRGPKVTPVELALIEAWIAEGALNN